MLKALQEERESALYSILATTAQEMDRSVIKSTKVQNAKVQNAKVSDTRMKK